MLKQTFVAATIVLGAAGVRFAAQQPAGATAGKVDFVRDILKTQFEDGSWFVRTRALPIQPHFETGFPYGRDQFISAAATNWATRALTLTLSVKPS